MTPGDYHALLIRERGYLCRLVQTIAWCDPPDAEDVLQGVLEGIEAAQIDETRASGKTYLIQAVKWGALNYRKQLKRREYQEVALPSDDFGTDEVPENALGCPQMQEAETLAGEVEDAINRLSERHRVVLRGYLDGYSFNEIGDRLGVTKQRVQQLHHEAVMELQRRLR